MKVHRAGSLWFNLVRFLLSKEMDILPFLNQLVKVCMFSESDSIFPKYINVPSETNTCSFFNNAGEHVTSKKLFPSKTKIEDDRDVLYRLRLFALLKE